MQAAQAVLQNGTLRSITAKQRTSARMVEVNAEVGRAPETPRIVVCGAGVIGCCVAYYLQKLGRTATIVEREAPACAASGKAGGFLALDWNDGTPVGPLARKSFELHQELAETLKMDVGYRRVETLQLIANRDGGRGARGEGLPTWVDGNISQWSVMGTPASTAQVHPERLTRALLSAAEAGGCTLKKGQVTGVRLNQDKSVQGVLLAGGDELPADVVVLAMGPWTSSSCSDLDLPRVGGQKYHSVVLRPALPVTSHMCFTTLRSSSGPSEEVEIYPRPDGTVYVCGEPEVIPVPSSPDQVVVHPHLCEKIRQNAGLAADCLDQAAVEAQQSCYLPTSSDGMPLIGPIPGTRGLFLATGHSCWGILNGPATGLAIAEMIVHGQSTSVQLTGLQPGRKSNAPW